MLTNLFYMLKIGKNSSVLKTKYETLKNYTSTNK